ncbi:DNA-binding response regulator [Flavobacterium sp. 9AF]|uniref:LytR/AlgR family response regulator transcription factor n=1 Tax=Flavobacterium sp. 9AF TaxID=2653142 RepID=UPI0012EFF353|nr:response regulator [Flavobacterium sp. 9AF]VXC29601.1 DNA-binding response regulator [Flavobacterium sp. 9AF]
MKAIVIDDEKRARLNLILLIEEYCKNVEIVAECENLSSGVKAIRKYKPDLVLLDIEMPGHSGLELLDFFDENEINFKIIFTTAYQEYALQAFKFSAIDYLLKPINPEELAHAIARIEKQKISNQNYSLLKETIRQDTLQRIAVPSGNSILFIETDTIMYLKGEGAYSEIRCINDIKYIVSRNLKNFEDILCNNPNFIRIHKSHIVNVNFISAYNKSDGGNVLLKNGLQLSITADKVQTILDQIQIVKR